MNAASFSLPKIAFDEPNLAAAWSKFRQAIGFYIDGLSTSNANMSNKRKIGLLMTAMGPGGLDIYNTFEVEEDSTYEDILELFDDYCKPKKNTVYERFVFSTLEQKDQTVDAYIVNLKKQAALCEYHNTEKDNLIRDRLVVGLKYSELRRELLRESDLTLQTAEERCRAYERSKLEDSEMAKPLTTEPKGDTLDIDAVAANKPSCRACNYRHYPRRCPAINSSCHKCGQIGHFASVCQSSEKFDGSQPRRRIHTVTEQAETCNDDAEPEGEIFHIFACSIDNRNNSDVRAWFVHVSITSRDMIKFKVDTGAECNVITQTDYLALTPRPVLEKTNARLAPYGSSDFIIPKGLIRVRAKCNGIECALVCYVVADTPRFKFDNLLSFRSSIDYRLINPVSELKHQNTRNPENCPHLFKGLGRLPGTVSIKVKPEFEPVISPLRRFAYSLMPRIREALDNMVNIGVIAQVTQPTPWVSNLLVVEKRDDPSKIRICIDPAFVNQAIIVPKYHIPKAEDLVARLAGKSLFSVFDMSKGFWQMVLDEESSFLTTFQTPFGRYRFLRMCFGISCAPEIFMQKIVEMFGDIEGVFPYFDDLIIAAADEEEHDQIVDQVLKRAESFNVRFNSEKLQYKQPSVKFLGLVISKDTSAINPDRCTAITNMPVPRDKKGVLRFLGMVKYVSAFVPNLSAKTENLRALTRPSTPFSWTEDHQAEFVKLKSALTTAPVLKIFDPAKPIRLQTDASKTGIGACLIQNNLPVAYASRALTATEIHYATIEKEMLAIVYALEKFHDYVYGADVTVITDHRPLINIVAKSFTKVSARLQRLKLRLLKYNFNIQYRPGKEMFLADTLSRAFTAEGSPEKPDIIHTVHACTTLVISPGQLSRWQEETQADIDLSRLKSIINSKWPTDKKLSPTLRKFKTIQHHITLENGVLFYENRLIVPAALKEETLHRIHEGHLGPQRNLEIATRTFFWLGMTRDVTEYVAACRTCAEWRRKSPREPLKLRPLPTRPWERVATDILHFENADYAVYFDAYSRWIELIKLRTKTASELIKVSKAIFARLGVPVSLISDNVPYASEEFQQFAKEWDFISDTTAPGYAQSNGLAEKAVSIAKNLLRKNDDISAALLQYRNAPIPDLHVSPAQLMMNRILRTDVAFIDHQLQPALPNSSSVNAFFNQRREAQIANYDKSAGSRRESIPTDSEVYVRGKLSDSKSKPATVLDTDGRRARVRLRDNTVLLRDRRFIQKPARYRDS